MFGLSNFSLSIEIVLWKVEERRQLYFYVLLLLFIHWFKFVFLLTNVSLCLCMCMCVCLCLCVFSSCSLLSQLAVSEWSNSQIPNERHEKRWSEHNSELRCASSWEGERTRSRRIKYIGEGKTCSCLLKVQLFYSISLSLSLWKFFILCYPFPPMQKNL